MFISPDKKVHMAVWFLCNQEPFRILANLFGIANRGTAHYCIMQVLQEIVGKLHNEYILWPQQSQYTLIANEFAEKNGFPDVIGCIDGTHIPIRPPANDRESYINRKGFPSVNVMAVSDHRMVFTDVFVDRAGSVHDARVLRVSPLGAKLINGEIGDAKFHILGDSAYPLLPHLLVPYRDNGHLSATQSRYNLLHSETRSVVERAFARLKGKLRRLKGLECTHISSALIIIKAAFVVHNFMLLHDADDDVFEYDEECGADAPLTSITAACDASSLHLNAALKRDKIAAAFL